MSCRSRHRWSALAVIGIRARVLIAVLLSLGLLAVGVSTSDAGSAGWLRSGPAPAASNLADAGVPASPRAAGAPGTATPSSASVSPQAATSGGRASGLPWHSGVFSHDAARTVAFNAARGRPSDVLAVFPTRDSWDTLLEDWWMSPSAVPPGFTGTLAVGVPLFPTNGSMEAAARGDDDARWTEMGRLIASRYPDAWVRPGWEMNISNWPWAATAQNVESYKQAFRRASTALKAGGPKLRVVFNPNEGRGDALPDARLAYPGDDVVDTIGIDAYDWDPSYADGGWAEHRDKDQGWNFWMRFAREHGKTFALPEWGVITGNANSGGDNPVYIESVLAWMTEHADTMAFDAYFEETADYCRCALSLNPGAQAAYTRALTRIGESPDQGQAGTTRPSAAYGGSDGSDAGSAGTDTATAPAGQAGRADDGTVARRTPGRGRFVRDDTNRTPPPDLAQSETPPATPREADPST